MESLPLEVKGFLLRAKRAREDAHGFAEAPLQRCPVGRERRYEEAEGWLYVDACMGNHRFSGTETVYRDGVPLWAMNYRGQTRSPDFDFAFLRAALRQAPEGAPFRGPIEYQEGPHLYCNQSAGDFGWFFGREEIYKSGVSVYECMYHGGEIK